MKTYLILLFILLAIPCLAQQNGESLIGHTHNFPMINASVYKLLCGHCCSDRTPSLVIRSKDSTISSITSGYVVGIFKIGDNDSVVLIKTLINSFITYTNFNKVYVSKNQSIEKGTLIGSAFKSEDSNIFEINIFFMNLNGYYLNEDKIWKLMQESDSATVIAKPKPPAVKAMKPEYKIQ